MFLFVIGFEAKPLFILCLTKPILVISLTKPLYAFLSLCFQLSLSKPS